MTAPALLSLALLLSYVGEAQTLEVDAGRFQARFHLGSLVWLSDGDGTVYVKPSESPAGLCIHRTGSDHAATAVEGPERLAGRGEVVRRYRPFADLGGAAAEATYRIGPEGDLTVCQKATSPAEGVWGVSWSIGRIPLDYAILVPGRSGVRLTTETPGRTHVFDYPMAWEAQLVVVEGQGRGFFVWAEDDRGRFKRLVVERNHDGWQLSLVTINFAPFDTLTACTSVPWRLDVYRGDWRVPARRYRQWMEAHFRPVPVEKQRPGWVKDIRAMVIMGLHREMLPALAERLDPAQTILYVPSWRSAGYDRDYPTYDQPYEGLEAFVAEAHERGFRVMLHVNYFGVDPLHPLYERFEPYQVRSPWGKHEKQWWVWDRVEPEIRFAYINPACKAWRDYFVEAMAALCRRYRVDALHLDQTLCLYNDHNGRIDGMSMIDGNLALHRQLREALPEVALSGEGLNEITCRYEAFAQRHAWGVNHADGTFNRRQLAAAHPISSYLLRPYTVINGYLGCAPPTQDQLYAAWNEAYEHWGVIPTLKPDRAQLLHPNSFSRQFFDEAAFWFRSRLRIDLEAAWPDDVAFPYRTADGQRAVRTCDGRFLCGERLISRTITRMEALEAPGTIPGWRVYDEKRLSGLDSERWYPYFDEPRDLESFHVEALPAGIICEGVVARDDLAVLRTEGRNDLVADLVERIDQATCGSRPFDAPPQEWTGPGSADDGGGFTDSGGGVLAAHPPWKAAWNDPATGQVRTGGTGTAFARFTVELPDGAPLCLTTDVALARGAMGPDRCDGVTFALEATDGKTRLRQERHHASEEPRSMELDLTPLAGRTATIELSVHPGPDRSASFDWARWHHPRIERRTQTEATLAFVGKGECQLALDRRGPQPIQQEGRRRKVRAQLPGSVLLLRQRPAQEPLPVDLVQQARSVVFLDDSGRELATAEHATMRPEQMTVGGVRRSGLFAHPPHHGRTIAYFPLALPPQPARYTCWLGLRDGSKSEGVVFAVEVNGREMARRRMVPGRWEPLSVDLSAWKGQPVVLALVTDADGSFQFDWACWGEPKLEPGPAEGPRE